MSFLNGKTATWTRCTVAPDGLIHALDDACGSDLLFYSLHNGSHTLESIGTCSWRSLLDGPIDRGLLNGDPDLWICGMRRDTKRAAPALVKAESARRVADYLQVCGGKIDRKHIHKIMKDTRDELNSVAEPKPSHGMMAAHLGLGLALFDGSSHMQEPFFKVGFSPMEEVPPRFLDWLVWGSLNEVFVEVGGLWADGSAVTFRDKDGAGADYRDIPNLAELQTDWASGGATIRRASFQMIVDDLDATFSLQGAGLKVCSLVFPEDLTSGGGIEARIHARIAFAFEVEKRLAGFLADYRDLCAKEMLPAKFTGLFPDAIPAQEEAAS